MPVSKNKKKPRKKPSPEVLAKRQAFLAAKAKEKAEAGPGPFPVKSGIPATAIRNRAALPGTVLSKVLATPSHDYTDHGKCSGCGACCTSVLPLTEYEKRILVQYAKDHGIEPELPKTPKNIIYMQCPFMDRKDHKCLVYPVRPLICQAYKCDRTTEENMREYLALSQRLEAPPASNAWELFGKTGLRTEDGEITPENANRADLVSDEDGSRLHIQVGRPVSLQLKDGTVLLHAMCLNITQDSMMVFHEGQTPTVNYQDIKKAL